MARQSKITGRFYTSRSILENTKKNMNYVVNDMSADILATLVGRVSETVGLLPDT